MAREKDPLYEGDGILLFCTKAEGFIYSPPPLRPNVTSVSVHPVSGNSASHPGFSNVHYASFLIHPKKKDRGVSDKTNKELVFGRKVYLYHVASKWYLSFNTTDNAISKTATLVNSRNNASVFRIISSDPLKSTGQTIRVEDNVRLEILEQPGERSQVLCVPNKLSFNGYELRKGSDGSDFTLYSQSTELKQGPPLALRGGEVVMFLNEKRDAFITVVKDSRVMAKVADGPDRGSIFTGGDSYWQIENAAIQYDGNWVDLGDPWAIRIKHLPSKHYLALVTDETTSNSYFSLVEDGNHDNCTFHFEEDRLEPDSGLFKRRYTLLKHNDSFVTVDGSSSVLVDGSRCFNIVPKPSTEAISDHRDRKFWIEEVDEEVLTKFAKLSGAFVTLKGYLTKLEEAESDQSDVVVALPTDTLKALAEWTTEEESRKGSKEKWPDMLRAIEGVELVLKFLKRKTESSTLMIQKKLCVVLENFIKFASEDSQLYLISKDELLKTLFPLLGCNVGAENVLSALIRCRCFGSTEKEKVLKTVFQPDTILRDVLYKEKAFVFLKCLSALCMSGGRPEKKIQLDLVERVIIPGHNQGIFFKINCQPDPEDPNKSVVSIDNPVMFEGIAMDNDRNLRNHLVQQILFYASVCEGVNIHCIEIMTGSDGLLTYKAANICLEYFDKFPAIQSAFYRYLVSSLVDKNAEESGTDLENIWCIYSWKRFVGSDKEEAVFKPTILSGLANTHDIVSDKEEMVRIQNQIQESLEKANWSRDIDEGREDLMTQKLHVLETLVAYGFYWTHEVGDDVVVPSPGKVIKALIEILNYEPNRDKQNLCKLQSKAIQVLILFLYQTYHLATSRIMFEFGYFNEPRTDLTNSNVPKSYFSDLIDEDFEMEKLLPDHVEIPALKKIVMNQKISDAHQRLRWILYEEKPDTTQLTFPGQPSTPDEYDYNYLNIYDEHSQELKILLMKFIASKDDELRLSAAKLFFELYQGENHLFQRANQSLIVMDTFPGSWETYTTMVKFATYQDKVKDDYIRALLRLSQGKGLDPKVKPSVIKFTNDVIAVSGTPPDSNGLFPRDETFNDKTGQDIVVTTGVFGVLLNYVVKYSIIDDVTQNELVNKVCDTLLTIVRNNNNTKRVVFERFHDLLQARQGVWSTAHLLTEVLTDNIMFCRELPFSTIRTMFRMAAIKDNINRDYHEFIPTIEAWMKVGKLSPHLLKKHQRFVALLFEQFFKDYYESDWDPETSPIQKLQEDDNDKFVLLVRLLAVCTEGIHKYSEDIARSVFKFSALIKIISMETIPLEKRLPFMALLNEAFIKTERESLLSVIDLAGDKTVWGHVELMTQWLTEMDKKLSAIKDNKKAVACQAIKIKLIFSQHMTHLYWKKHQVYKVNMKSAFKEDHITLEGQSNSLAILYQYLIEGLVPMLSSFAEEYNSLWIQYQDKIGSDRKPLSDTDKNLLMTFTKQLHEMVCKHSTIFVTTSQQKDYWSHHLRLLLSLEDNPDQMFELGAEPAVIVSEVPEPKKKEDSVNMKFKIYLNNFRKMIHHKEDEGNDAAALYPSGPGFQELVNFFLQDNDQISTKICHLVELLRILYKDLQQSYDSKRIESLTALTIQIVQVISYILNRTVPDEENDNEDLVERKFKSLKARQKICLDQNVHNICMLLLNLDNNEICLQVFGLLTLITLDANLTAQEKIFEGVSSRDSLFCRRIYMVLEGVSETFRETWASELTDKKDQPQELAASDKTRQMNGFEMKPKDKKPELLTRYSIVEGSGTLGLDSLDDTIRTAGIVLDCISALCDGQQKEMQRFLLDQDKSFKKLDIIKKVAILLDILTEEYVKTLEFSAECSSKTVFSYLDLIQKAIQAIIETVAGNFENQEAVFQCQATDTINYLLTNLINETLISTQTWSRDEQSEIQIKKRKLNEKAIELLQILLEETDERSGALIANFTEDVDLEAIVKAMFYWKEIEAYHILRLVATCKDVSVDKLMFKRMQEWDDQQKDLWKDFKARSRCVEVLYEPDKDKHTKILTKVYFDFDPMDELPEEFKDTVSNAISEEALEKNLTEFNEWGRAIRKNAEYQHKFLHGNSWFWLFIYRLFYETSAPRNLLLVFLTIVLNLLTLAVFLVPKNRTFNETKNAPNFILYPDVPTWYFPVLLPILGIIHIMLSVWMYTEFILKEFPNFTRQMFFVTFAEQISQSFKRWVSQQEFFKDKCPKDWRLKQKQRKVKVNYTPEQGEDLDEIIQDPNYEDPYYYEDDDENDGYFKIDFFGFQSLYRLIFLACSIAAIFLRGYTYCICLFYVFLKVDVVQYILTALTRARKQLCFVFFISAGVLLMFAMAAFIFLHDYLEPSNSLFCSNLWECYITVTREGLLDTVGLAIPHTLEAQGDDAVPSYENYALRSLFFDIPFFIVVTTIILNIVTAVLIDRFSDLRGERDQVESNKMKACFICGIETEKFERKGKGFRDHVKEDHNKWNYIYYLIHLDRKNTNDLTALEKQIADNNGMDKKYGKTDHYPIEQAKVLE